ncbi:MAG: addiction module antitoxin [Deltaproteobacteria bacterium]|nr:addiction module antitoxin [Deltaproteobacteria bacterium]
MQKKLTITVDEKIYEGLHSVIGRGRISRFVESLVRPHVVCKELEAAYAKMADDEQREKEALAWSEATIRDIDDETR